MAVVLLLMTVAQIVASCRVQIKKLKDTYRDEAGNLQTVTYTVKRDSKTGLYALYNKKGTKMQEAPDTGYNHYNDGVDSYAVYETEVGGNQYRINTSTGDYALYAAVDPEGDEALGGSAVNTFLLMFPRISEPDTTCLEIANQTGRYRVETTNGGSLLSVWYEGEWVPCQADVINRQAYVSLCVSCGYAIARQKLDLTDPAVPHHADGSVDYAAYGLEDVAATYTITSGEKQYTVLIGNLTVSGDRYYAKREDRDAVYLVDTDFAAVLEPVESLVTAAAIYPMTETTFPMVENFALYKVDGYNSETGDFSTSELVTAFSYQDLSLRQYTLYQTTPYVIPESISFLNGYSINDWNISELLLKLYQMQPLACKKLMPDFEDLEPYGLTENVLFLTFEYDIRANASGTGPYVRNSVLISQKRYDQELGQEVCYLYSTSPAQISDDLFGWGYDMVIAVDPYYLPFLEWGQSQWYLPNYYSGDLSYVRELHLTLGEKNYDFYLDNSKTDLSGGLSTENLEILCPQYDSPDHKLNYQVHTSQTTDTGEEKALDYTGAQNFKRFNAKLFQGEIEGDVDEAQFLAATGMTVAEFIAADTADDKCIAKIRYHMEDYAKDYNPYWKANNRRDIVLRFYEYESSGRKYLMTVEVLQRDANGNLVTNESGEVLTDATRANGLFYVNSASLGVLAGYAEDLLAKVLIPL